MAARPLTEALHKACGSVEVAKDLVGRSASLYLRAESSPEPLVTERFAEATRALSSVMEVLQVKLIETSLGPAA